jgi:hypothetical protein
MSASVRTTNGPHTVDGVAPGSHQGSTGLRAGSAAGIPRDGRGRHSRGRTRSRCSRVLMLSLVNTLRRWYSTVRGLMNRRAPISAFDRPSRANCAICVSWAVSSSRPQNTATDARAGVASARLTCGRAAESFRNAPPDQDASQREDLMTAKADRVRLGQARVELDRRIRPELGSASAVALF